MSEAHAHAEPAKKEAPAAHAAPAAAPKKGVVSKIWNANGVVIAGGLGVIVLLTLGTSMLVMGFDGISNAMLALGNGLIRLAKDFLVFPAAIREWNFSIIKMIMAIAPIALLAIIVGMIGKIILGEIKKAKQ